MKNPLNFRMIELSTRTVRKFEVIAKKAVSKSTSILRFYGRNHFLSEVVIIIMII